MDRKICGIKNQRPEHHASDKKDAESGNHGGLRVSGKSGGFGQGSVCSPILANIYMHYVLLWWFEEKVKPKMRGYCGLIVYADDFVACFQYKEEAEEFYSRLKHRMEHFGLSLEEEKSRLIEFGRFCKRKSRA